MRERVDKFEARDKRHKRGGMRQKSGKMSCLGRNNQDYKCLGRNSGYLINCAPSDEVMMLLDTLLVIERPEKSV